MEVFVARQPIFDTGTRVFAYELLFRSGIENFYDGSMDGDQTTSKLISNSFMVIGLEDIVKGKPAFINFTRNLLVRGAPSVIPKDLITVEILETVDPDEAVIKACRGLKNAGYVLALDDFIFQEKFRPLIDLADIIKVDFTLTKGQSRRTVMELCNNRTVSFLAEKVETYEDFREALDLGYSYFQGYFFSKPVIVSGRDIPSNKLDSLRILHEVNKPDADFDNIEKVIKHDLSLSYKLIKFINSVFFNLNVKIESIRHALVLLGINEIRKWVSLIAMTAMAEDKPQELMNVSLIRARFCEYIAPHVGLQQRSSDLFLMGLFSVIDAIIDKPMESILKELPLSEDIKGALLEEQGSVFFHVYKLVLSYEQADWKGAAAYARELAIEEGELPEFFMSSVKWANVAL